MSNKIKKRLQSVLLDGMSTYKQYLANELQHAKLTLKLTEEQR